MDETTLSGDTSVSAVTGIRIVLYGDVDMNGEVNTMDATEIQLYLADMKDLTLEQLYAADVDGNDDISIVDITYIQQYIAQIITTFPIEE